MSATNRGSVRNERDFYQTPLSAFEPLIPYLPKDKKIWEPACGDGRLVDAMRTAGLDAYGSDIEPQGNYEILDFLASDKREQVILTNPPFSLDFEFVQHSVKCADEVFLLLRLPFLASKERKSWFQKNEPSALFVLAERPSFARVVKCADKKIRKQIKEGETPHCEWRTSLLAGADWPRNCPVCNQKTEKCDSDNSDYAWYFWGDRYKGIFHL